MDRRPTLLHSCARAATAAEARFRIDHPNSTTRASLIIALDPAAASIVEHISSRQWNGARFLVYEGESPSPNAHPEANLRAVGGASSQLSDELDGADVVVMIATGDQGAEAASIIGRACGRLHIMTAGLVVASGSALGDAMNALRPYASVLVLSADDQYIPEMLAALRA